MRTLPTFFLSASVLACVIAAGCKSLGFDDLSPSSNSFGGVVTGTVLDASQNPAVSATVYLVDPNRDPGDDVLAETASFLNEGGRFRIEAPSGVYTLVAKSTPDGLAAYVDGITVSDGASIELGNVQLVMCDDPIASPPVPCPPPFDMGVPPPPSFELSNFVPDYTEVFRDTGAGYDDLYLRSENYYAGVTLEMAFTGATGFAVGTHDLSGPGNLGVFLGYYDAPSGIFAGYVAVSGSLLVDVYDITPGGTVTVRVQNGFFEYYDQVSSGLDDKHTVTLLQTEPMSGVVSANPTPTP